MSAGSREAAITAKSQGIIAGIFGCVFGVLGILTLGIIFVPLAALRSLIGLVRGAGGLSIFGNAVRGLAKNERYSL